MFSISTRDQHILITLDPESHLIGTLIMPAAPLPAFIPPLPALAPAVPALPPDPDAPVPAAGMSLPPELPQPMTANPSNPPPPIANSSRCFKP